MARKPKLIIKKKSMHPEYKEKKECRMEKARQQRVYELLKRGLKLIEDGDELPVEWAREFFPPERREYELIYHGVGGVWCEINNLGGSHGRIGFEYRQLGEIHEIPLKTRRKIMFEILEHKTCKDYSPNKSAYSGNMRKKRGNAAGADCFKEKCVE